MTSIQEQNWIEAPEEIRAKCRAICGEDYEENDLIESHIYNQRVYVYTKKEIDTATDMAYQAGLEEGKRMERERINTKMRNLFLELDDEIGIANSAKLAMFIRTALTPEEAPKTATP